MYAADVFPPDEIEPVAALGRSWADAIEAVVILVTRTGAGSGVLIARDRVLTAHHVVPDVSVLANAGVRQGMHGSNAGTRLLPQPSGFFRTSPELDYTVFSIEPVTWVT